MSKLIAVILCLTLLAATSSARTKLDLDDPIYSQQIYLASAKFSSENSLSTCSSDANGPTARHHGGKLYLRGDCILLAQGPMGGGLSWPERQAVNDAIIGSPGFWIVLLVAVVAIAVGVNELTKD